MGFNSAFKGLDIQIICMCLVQLQPSLGNSEAQFLVAEKCHCLVNLFSFE
jgi:hypothetical protein